MKSLNLAKAVVGVANLFMALSITVTACLAKVPVEWLIIALVAMDFGFHFLFSAMEVNR